MRVKVIPSLLMLAALIYAVAGLVVHGQPRTRLDPETARRIVLTARAFDLPPLLVLEVMRRESAFNARATSYKNGRPCAHGLMQMVPATASRFGISDPYDPQQAILGGCRYLRWLTQRYGRARLDLILAAYNAGEGAVDRYRGVPPYAETEAYVASILDAYSRAEGLYGSARATHRSRSTSHRSSPSPEVAPSRRRMLTQNRPSLKGV